MVWSHKINKVKGWEIDDDLIEELIDEGVIENIGLYFCLTGDFEKVLEHYKNNEELYEKLNKSQDLSPISESLVAIRFIKHEGINHEIWYYGQYIEGDYDMAVLPYKWKENQSGLIKLFKIEKEADIIEFVTMD